MNGAILSAALILGVVLFIVLVALGMRALGRSSRDRYEDDFEDEEEYDEEYQMDEGDEEEPEASRSGTWNRLRSRTSARLGLGERGDAPDDGEEWGDSGGLSDDDFWSSLSGDDDRSFGGGRERAAAPPAGLGAERPAASRSAPVKGYSLPNGTDPNLEMLASLGSPAAPQSAPPTPTAASVGDSSPGGMPPVPRSTDSSPGGMPPVPRASGFGAGAASLAAPTPPSRDERLPTSPPVMPSPQSGTAESDPGLRNPYDSGSFSRPTAGARSAHDSGSFSRSPAPDPLTDPSFTPGAGTVPGGDSPIWSSLDTGSHQRPQGSPSATYGAGGYENRAPHPGGAGSASYGDTTRAYPPAAASGYRGGSEAGGSTGSFYYPTSRPEQPYSQPEPTYPSSGPAYPSSGPAYPSSGPPPAYTPPQPPPPVPEPTYPAAPAFPAAQPGPSAPPASPYDTQVSPQYPPLPPAAPQSSPGYGSGLPRTDVMAYPPPGPPSGGYSGGGYESGPGPRSGYPDVLGGPPSSSGGYYSQPPNYDPLGQPVQPGEEPVQGDWAQQYPGPPPGQGNPGGYNDPGPYPYGDLYR